MQLSSMRVLLLRVLCACKAVQVDVKPVLHRSLSGVLPSPSPQSDLLFLLGTLK